MTALVSKIDFHNFGKYFFYKLKRLRPCLVTQVIAALLSYPLAAIVFKVGIDLDIQLQAARDAYYNSKNGDFYDETLYMAVEAMEQRMDTFLMIMLVCVAVAIAALATMAVMHYIVPLLSFRWLYKKNCADMDYSLPISSDARFWGDFLAGFTIVVPPHLISAIFGLVFLQSLQNLEGFDYYYDAMIKEILAYATPLVWTVFLGLIMLYCLSVLVMGFCGKLGHAVAMPILVNLSVPVTHYLLFWLSQSYAEGSWGYSSYMLIQSIFVTSPAGMVLSSLESLVFMSDNTGQQYFEPSNYFPIQQPRYLIPALIVIVLIILGAWLVIRRRRAEQVGTRAFAVKPAQYVIHGLAALMICTIAAWQISRNFENHYFYYGVNAVVPPLYDIINIYSMLLIIAIPVVYIILEFAARDAKSFGWSLVRCGGTFIGVTGITLAVMCSNGFGTFLRAPNTKDVGMVRVWISEENSRNYFSYSFAEQENIELIARLHSSAEKKYTYGNIFTMADRLNNDPESFANAIRFEVQYYTYNGHRKDCNFEITKETREEILRALAIPEALTNDCYNIRKNAGEILGTLPSGTSGSVLSPAKSGLTTDMLREAIRKDSENVTFERMFKCEPGNIERWVYFRVAPDYYDPYDTVITVNNYNNVISSDETGSIKVYPWFENTLELLSEYGIEVDFDIDPDNYETAFIVKSTPADDGQVWYFQCYSYLGVSLDSLFGLAGDENFAARYRDSHGDRDGTVYRYDDETGERVPMTDDDIMDKIKSEYRYVQAAKIDMEQVTELLPLCGSVYDVDTDYGSDHYALVLTNLTSEDLLHYDDDLSIDYMFLYIPAEYFDKAAELFNAAA